MSLAALLFIVANGIVRVVNNDKLRFRARARARISCWVDWL